MVYFYSNFIGNLLSDSEDSEDEDANAPGNLSEVGTVNFLIKATLCSAKYDISIFLSFK